MAIAGEEYTDNYEIQVTELNTNTAHEQTDKSDHSRKL
jgi:hypothetical protein